MGSFGKSRPHKANSAKKEEAKQEKA